MTHRPVISLSLVALLALHAPLQATWEQEQPGPKPSKLRLEIIEGDGAINNIRQRVAREPVVQVEDENRKPVAGAVVVFTLPQRGASGVFGDGSRILTLLTDQNGRAIARGLQPNGVAGRMPIRVNASFRGVTASRTIVQTNSVAGAGAGGAAAGGAAGAAGGGGGAAGGAVAGGAAAGAAIGAAKIVAIVAAVGGAAAAGVAVAVAKGNGNGSSGPVTGTPPATITPGTPTVGPPR